MNAHVGEIVAEARLHKLARGRIERLASSIRRPDIRLGRETIGTCLRGLPLQESGFFFDGRFRDRLALARGASSTASALALCDPLLGAMIAHALLNAAHDERASGTVGATLHERARAVGTHRAQDAPERMRREVLR